MSTQNKTYVKLLETLCDFVNPMNYIINYLNQVWSSCVNQKDVHYEKYSYKLIKLSLKSPHFRP